MPIISHLPRPVKEKSLGTGLASGVFGPRLIGGWGPGVSPPTSIMPGGWHAFCGLDPRSLHRKSIFKSEIEFPRGKKFPGKFRGREREREKPLGELNLNQFSPWEISPWENYFSVVPWICTRPSQVVCGSGDSSFFSNSSPPGHTGSDTRSQNAIIPWTE